MKKETTEVPVYKTLEDLPEKENVNPFKAWANEMMKNPEFVDKLSKTYNSSNILKKKLSKKK